MDIIEHRSGDHLHGRGGNRGAPASFACNNGSTIGSDACASEGGVWFPDLRTREVIWGAGVMVKF